MRMVEGNEAKTTCVKWYGSFEFLVMPFDFCNLMNDVLFDFLDSFVVVHLDDIMNNNLDSKRSLDTP